MAVFARCDFSGDPATTLVDAHTTADLTPHPTWIRNTAAAGTAAISNAGRARATSSSAGIYYHNGAPADADYSVFGTLRCFSNTGLWSLGARMSATPTNTYYFAGYDFANTRWFIGKLVSGTQTLTLGTAAAALSVGSSYLCRFEVEGTALRLYVDDALTCSATDSSISAAGFAGFRLQTGSDTAGYHLDDWSADDDVISAASASTGGASRMLLMGVGG